MNDNTYLGKKVEEVAGTFTLTSLAVTVVSDRVTQEVRRQFANARNITPERSYLQRHVSDRLGARTADKQLENALVMRNFESPVHRTVAGHELTSIG